MKTALNRMARLAGIAWLALVSAAALAGGFVELDGQFTPGTSRDITNPWWPLPEGAQYIYLAEEDDECVVSLLEVLPPAGAEGGYRTHINGADVRAVRDVEAIDHDGTCDGAGVLEGLETTIDWYAQDDDGNVWYFGEHTVSLDTPQDECDWYTFSDDVWSLEGCLDGSWVAGTDIANIGVDPAEQGIIMLAEPKKGLFYFQEYYEDFATDMGKILNFKDVDSVIDGEIEGCAMIKEWVPLEPGNVEHKYYCYGYGLVQVEGNAGGPTVWTDLVWTNLALPLY